MRFDAVGNGIVYQDGECTLSRLQQHGMETEFAEIGRSVFRCAFYF
jgi:hypothetical protein